MNKQAISVTLESENLSWLRTQAAVRGCRSVSQLLDHLIADARRQMIQSPVQSVVGTVKIDPGDPELQEADKVIRALFQTAGLDG